MTTAPVASATASTSSSKGVFEKLVDQDGVPGRSINGLGHVTVERAGIVDDRHRAPPQHIRRPHNEGVADRPRDLPRLLTRGRDAARRLGDPEVPQQPREPLAVLGQVDRVRRGAEYRHPLRLQREGELQRRLPAKLHDARDVAARRPLLVDDGQDVLQGQRLEVEPVDGVVVSRHRLGVGVDHHGLEPFFLERERRVTTTVVELDALPDPVGPGAQDDDLATVRRSRLAFLLVGPVEIRGERLELGRAGVDALIDRLDPRLPVSVTDERRFHREHTAQLLVAEPGAFQNLQQIPGHLTQPDETRRPLQLNDLRELRQEPPVNPGQLVHLIDAPATLEGTEHREHAAVGRHHELSLQRRIVLLLARGPRLREEPGRSGRSPAIESP